MGSPAPTYALGIDLGTTNLKVALTRGTSGTVMFETTMPTRADVLARLGPPSQVIASGDETVLYYLNEHAEGEGLLLVLYNRFEVDTRYDRAIFFFDADDRLTDYSTWLRPADDD